MINTSFDMLFSSKDAAIAFVEKSFAYKHIDASDRDFFVEGVRALDCDVKDSVPEGEAICDYYGWGIRLTLTRAEGGQSRAKLSKGTGYLRINEHKISVGRELIVHGLRRP